LASKNKNPLASMASVFFLLTNSSSADPDLFSDLASANFQLHVLASLASVWQSLSTPLYDVLYLQVLLFTFFVHWFTFSVYC
jgi:hypothetical protein